MKKQKSKREMSAAEKGKSDAGAGKSLAPPPAGQSGRVSPSGRISPAVGRMSPGADAMTGESAKMPGEASASRSPSNGKLLRIMTVVAYLCSVSGAAFMLSLYYIFLWDPSAHAGETRPAAFHAGAASALPSDAARSPTLRAIANATLNHTD